MPSARRRARAIGTRRSRPPQSAAVVRADGAVEARRRHQLRARGEYCRGHLLLVPGQEEEPVGGEVGAGRVPDPGLARACGDDPATVVAEAGAGDEGGVAAIGAERVTGRDVPRARVLVAARRDEPLSVRGEGDSRDAEERRGVAGIVAARTASPAHRRARARGAPHRRRHLSRSSRRQARRRRRRSRARPPRSMQRPVSV